MSKLLNNTTGLQEILETLQTKAAGGGDTSIEDSLVTRTVSNYTNNRVIAVGSYAFYECPNLTAVSFPNATTISNGAFVNCHSLITASFPAATTIGSSAFYYCRNLTTASFPNATTISSSAFTYCHSLATASFPNAMTIGRGVFYTCINLATASFPVATTISNYAFANCYNLKALYLTGSRVCTLSNSNAFTSTPIGGYSASAGTYGSIYVPASLVTAYQTATNWTYFSSRFVAIGGDAGNTISFTINGTTYQAEEGMTWGEWVDSKYNTIGCYDDGDCIACINTGIVNYAPNGALLYIYDQDYEYVMPGKLIIEGYSYSLAD